MRFIQTQLFYKLSFSGLPWASRVKNPPSSSGITGLISGRGTEIPHARGQLTPRAAVIPESMSATREAHMLQLRPDATK